MKHIVLCMAVLLMTGCLGYPEKVKPVQGFELKRYLGTWYEIARLDHSFERGLEKVTAEYSLREDGGVAVKNRGYSAAKKKWKEAKGKAYFVRQKDEGYLKVSFFGPFYGAYVIFYLDSDYKHAFVCSSSDSYLWLLSRTPTVGEKVISDFLKKAATMGFPVDKLIYVNQK